jgi:hypothetical protein
LYCFLNSILVDTINYTNEFNKENKQKAKEQEEEKALAKEQAKAMLKMLADSNVKNESIDEKVDFIKESYNRNYKEIYPIVRQSRILKEIKFEDLPDLKFKFN